MDNIVETGRIFESESQIKIVRKNPSEKSEPVESVYVNAPSDLDEPEGTIQAPGVEPAPAHQKIEPVWDEMKAGYRYAAGDWRPKA